MALILSGSLAFDRFMSYPGVYADSIIPEKIHQLNLSFLMNKSKRVYGGTAGNIGYNLKLLNEKPLIATSLGDDPDGCDYRRRFIDWGFPLTAVKTHPGHLTASCLIATDRNKNQLTFFHPGAMFESSGFDPTTLPPPYDAHLAIISAGGPEEMKSLSTAYRHLGCRFICDPGQQIHVFSKDELLDLAEGAFIFTCNEYEFELFKKITGLDLEGLFQLVQAVVITRGEKGCDLLVPGRGSQHITPVPVSQVNNPTGAGDAFRAGLIKGLAQGEHLITACRLGATIASFCVETDGTQEHSFTLPQVIARHLAAFKEQLALN
ncbi:MAG: carbohydrate kinase family protein [Candidatus Adiutrix intracellularis]|jgi:adenosine kinase|nr:carbohydrate kinase family protein [Candidatus Adiutrix intracellularis]